MKIFPNKIFGDMGSYLDSYAAEVASAYSSINREDIRAAAQCLKEAVKAGRTIFSCGNGGSCAIANHLACDYLKGIQGGTDLRPRVISLSSSLELITAIANDITYEDVFAYQMLSMAKPDDLLLTISSSGNSPNIVNALTWANENGLHTIAMTGFSGGKARQLAEISLHVDAWNYGVVEDVHQSMMHMLAQFIRQGALKDPSQIGHCKF